jgi:hypothetical protein
VGRGRREEGGGEAPDTRPSHNAKTQAGQDTTKDKTPTEDTLTSEKR